MEKPLTGMNDYDNIIQRTIYDFHAHESQVLISELLKLTLKDETGFKGVTYMHTEKR